MTTPMAPAGILLKSSSSECGERVFLVEGGRRHWVRDGEWIFRNGFRWPEDVFDVEPETLYSFANSSAAPVRTAEDLDTLGEGMTSTDMREIVAAALQGTGIEFGARASPYPVPLHCEVRYADPFSYEALRASLYPGQTLNQVVRPDYVTDLQTLDGVADESLDFIVACHVIEHTVSPITAIKSCHRALKPGGSLVLVVPDMVKTFDRDRELTPLSHLIEDERNPSRSRDRGHFEEFYTKVFPLPDPSAVKQHAADKHRQGADIHYHCWTYESFAAMVGWISDDGTPWSAVWSHPSLPGAENIEFYFVLVK